MYQSRLACTHAERPKRHKLVGLPAADLTFFNVRSERHCRTALALVYKVELPTLFFYILCFLSWREKKTNVCMIVFPIFFLSKFCMCIVADKERVAETNAEESAKKLLS
jgi:hypothetical protein